ncbi:hypothetical protein GGI12_003943 [Dipsacomyces acuminosporus]|nr:hypothetical protein GGI12_003943 [Dipsacomyces acuminosporus]
MHTANLLDKRAPRLTDEQRVQAAAKLGLKLDPVGTSDTISIAVIFSALGLVSILIIIAWLNRDYKPIKAKNLPNITLIYIVSVIGMSGVLPGNNIVPVVGIWSYCRFWSVWVRMSLTYTFIFLIIFRTHALYRVFIQKRPNKGIGYYWPAALYVVFQLSFNIAATAVSPERSVRYIPSLELCSYGRGFHIACIAFAGIFWLIHTIYIFLTRNITSSFNEFRESLIIYLVGIANLIEVLCLHLFVKHYPLYKNIRIISAVFDLLCVCTPVVVLLANPVYKCLFHKHEYYANWVQKVLDDGLQRQYEFEENQTFLTTPGFMSDDSDKYSCKDSSFHYSTSLTEGSVTPVEGSCSSMHKSSRNLV